jgi:hypothetical protein
MGASKTRPRRLHGSLAPKATALHQAYLTNEEMGGQGGTEDAKSSGLAHVDGFDKDMQLRERVSQSPCSSPNASCMILAQSTRLPAGCQPRAA